MSVFIQFYEPEVKLTTNIQFSDVTFIWHPDDQLTLFEVIMSFCFSTLPPGGQLPNCIFRMQFLTSLIWFFVCFAHSIDVYHPHVFLSLLLNSRSIILDRFEMFDLLHVSVSVSVEKHTHTKIIPVLKYTAIFLLESNTLVS